MDQQQLAQLQILYKARGKKIEELTNKLEVSMGDAARELRILKHQLSVLEVHAGYSHNPLPDKILDWSKLKHFADDILNAFKNKNKCHIGWKTLSGKEKWLVTRHFPFSHNVFHSYISLVG